MQIAGSDRPAITTADLGFASETESFVVLKARFRSTDGVEQVQEGWLTHESLVQLKFFNSPVAIWKKKFRRAKISFKVSPVDLVRKMSAFHANVSMND